MDIYFLMFFFFNKIIRKEKYVVEYIDMLVCCSSRFNVDLNVW